MVIDRAPARLRMLLFIVKIAPHKNVRVTHDLYLIIYSPSLSSGKVQSHLSMNQHALLHRNYLHFKKSF